MTEEHVFVVHDKCEPNGIQMYIDRACVRFIRRCSSADGSVEVQMLGGREIVIRMPYGAACLALMPLVEVALTDGLGTALVNPAAVALAWDTSGRRIIEFSDGSMLTVIPEMALNEFSRR